MAESTLLKDFYNEALVLSISASVFKVWPHFDQNAFVQNTVVKFGPLSLTERAWVISGSLFDILPKKYPEAAEIIMLSFQNIPEQAMKGMDGFYYMPFGNYVAKYGLDHFEISIDLLKEITKRFTSEFPIRVFITQYPSRMITVLHDWAEDENMHVRRLVSEGTRTRLPWASRLPEFQRDPAPVLALLEKLKADPELYVRRSVANNLNDIGKDHPELVIGVLTKWSRYQDPGTQWIIKHASRSLVKEGNAKALALLGFDPDIDVNITDLQTDQSVRIGEVLSFSFALHSKETEQKEVMVDFVVHYMKANGRMAPKVFKLAKSDLQPGERRKFFKKLSFKPISTRRYYAGKHNIEIQVNGKRLGKVSFELLPA